MLDINTIFNIFIVLFAAAVVYRLISIRVLSLPVAERRIALLRMWPTLLFIVVIVLLVVFSQQIFTINYNIFQQNK